MARALGWPGECFEWACILTVLADAGGDLTGAEVRRRVAAIRLTYRGVDLAMTKGRFYSGICELGQRGLLRKFRPGNGKPRLYRISAAALGLRGPVAPYVPVRGADLAGDRYRGYARVEERAAV
jgi:hypothetical protein